MEQTDNCGLITDYLENKLANYILRNKEYEAPKNIYAGLFYEDPTDTGKTVELTGSGYKREFVKFDSPKNGLVSNAENVIFDKALSSWKVVTHIGLFDAEKGGNLLYHGLLSEPITITKGKNFFIKIGNLQAGIE